MTTAGTTTGLEWARWPGGWTVGQLPLLANLPGIRHAVSTRHGPDGADLRGPAGPACRDSLARAMGARQCVSVVQVHGHRVVDAVEALAGNVEADGIVTDQRGLAVLGLSADCPIVLAADVERGVVGMAHASWRGTVAAISRELIAAMVQRGCRPGDILAAVGPSAGPENYEVGPDVLAAARDGLGRDADAFFRIRQGRLYLDLWRANVAQLFGAGLCEHNIAVAGVCTIADERFFSYRREGPDTGRFGCAIARI